MHIIIPAAARCAAAPWRSRSAGGPAATRLQAIRCNDNNNDNDNDNNSNHNNRNNTNTNTDYTNTKANNISIMAIIRIMIVNQL